MKTNQAEKILKKYLTVVKDSEYYVARSDEWTYISDGCSILKIKTAKLAEMKENPLPEVGIDKTVQYSHIEKDFVKSAMQAETFESFLANTEKESKYILVNTGFTKKADRKQNLVILKIILENKDGDFYLLNEKYLKIAEMIAGYIYCTDSNVKGCICTDNWDNELKTIEFLALPCRIKENFFTPLAGIENYFKEV